MSSPLPTPFTYEYLRVLNRFLPSEGATVTVVQVRGPQPPTFQHHSLLLRWDRRYAEPLYIWVDVRCAYWLRPTELSRPISTADERPVDGQGGNSGDGGAP